MLVCLKKAFEQHVQEAPALERRCDALGGHRQQVVGHGSVQRRQDGGQRLRRARLEQGRREAVGEAQGVHQELEGQLAGGDRALFLHRLAGADLGQVGVGVLPAHLAQHPVMQRQLGMGAGADPQVVAEMPVVQVVAALLAGPGEGRGLVVGVAGRRQPLLDCLLHVGAQVAFGQLRRKGGEVGVRLERQLVAGEVRRGEGERAVDVG